jgi:hypothetical protein
MLDSALVDLTHAPPLFSGPLFALLFWWLAVALGYRVLRLSRTPLAGFTLWERGFLCAAIGAGTLQLLPLLLSAFGLLHPIGIRFGLGALALALAPDLVQMGRRFAAGVSTLQLRDRSFGSMIWWSLFLVFMGILLVHSVTFGVFGDDDGIHLATPKRWLQVGSLSYLPTYSLTNATLGFDMLYLIAMAVWSPVGAKILHYSAGAFAILGLFFCARRLGHSVAAMLAISVLLIPTPLFDVPPLFGNAMIDLAACWMTIAALLIWLVWRAQPDRRLLLCMALCAGFAASFKLTSVQVAIALLPVLVVDSLKHGASWREVARLVMVFGCVTLAAVLPWFVRNAVLTGNPLYPMLSTWLPTRDWPAEHAAIFGRYVKYYAWAPGRLLTEFQRQQLLVVAALLVALAALVAAWLVDDRVRRSVIAFATIFILISISLTGLTFRYWLPAIMCLALVAGTWCAQRWSRRVLVFPAVVLLIVGLAIHARRGFYFHQPLGLRGDLRMATGISTFEGEYASDPLVNIWEYINLNTPPDARILFGAFYTTYGASSYAGFWVNRTCYTTDSHFQAYFPLSDWDSFKESIKRERITHVVLSDEQFNAGRLSFTFPAEENEFPFVRRLAAHHGEVLYRAGHAKLYRLVLDTD